VKSLCDINLLISGLLSNLLDSAQGDSGLNGRVRQALWQSLKNRRAADLQCKTDKRPFTANAIFDQIEGRWSMLHGQY
jgi:hypothetical protein